MIQQFFLTSIQCKNIFRYQRKKIVMIVNTAFIPQNFIETITALNKNLKCFHVCIATFNILYIALNRDYHKVGHNVTVLFSKLYFEM